MSARVQRSLRAAALGAAALVLTVAGMLLGLRLAGPSEHETAIGRIEVRVEPSLHGDVDAYIPLADWGVRANAFDAPLRLAVQPRSLARPVLVRAVAGDPGLVRELEKDLRGAARAAMARALGWAAGGALALGLLVALGLSRRGHRRAVLLAVPATTLGLALLICAASFWRVQASFDAAAFSSPSFYARGAEIGQLVRAYENAREVGEQYAGSVERALTGFASLLADASGAGASSAGTLGPPGPGPAEPGRRLMLAADLHDNLLVLDPLRTLLAGAPVLFAGDFGMDGNAAEARVLAPRIAALGEVVAVSGNHDSALLMRELAAAGVTVLTEDGRLDAAGRARGPATVDVQGLRVAGFRDPLEWPGEDPADPERVFSFSELPDGPAARRAAEERLVAWFAALRPAPDVVLVHQNGLAQALARSLAMDGYDRPLAILTGHDHRQHVDRYGLVTVVDAGTVGAGGLFGVGSAAIGVAALHFTARDPGLSSADLLEVEPLSGEAQARREVITGSCEQPPEVCGDPPG